MKKPATVLMTAIFFLTLSGCTAYTDTYDEAYEMPYSEIRVDIGLGHDFTVLHTSDTHLTLAGGDDSRKMQKTAVSRAQYFDHQEEKLDYIALFARKHRYPIVHSGDLIDFIDEANLLKGKAFLQNPYNDILAFTAGNHEFVQSFGDTENAEYRNQSLQKINDMYGKDVRFSLTEREGVTFIALDDSYHLIDGEQLAKLKEGVEKSPYPVVLVIHAPLYEESLFEERMKTEDSAFLTAVPEEKTANYPSYRYETQKADLITYEAYDYIVNERKIKAILSGHIHMEYVSDLRAGLTQIVTGTDAFRLVTFY